MITWRTLLAASAALVVATTGSIADAAVSGCKLVKVEDWPIRVQRNLLVVDGAINGKKISVMLDTGAPRTLIFRAAAVRLGLPLSGTTNVRMFGVGGETKVDVALVDEFRVGQAAQKQLRILVAGENDGGGDVGVLLGEDFFQRFDVEFDVAHNAVRLFQPKDCDGVSLAYWARTGASEVEFEAMDVNHPEIILAVQINGQPLKAKLDSGAALSMLDKTDAERVGVTPETPGVIATGSGLGMDKKAVDSWIGPFRSFTIGNETIENTEISFSDVYKDATYRATGSNLSHKIQVSHSMLLGADFLRSHRVLVAHSRRKMYFTYTGGPVFRSDQAEWTATYDAGTTASRAAQYSATATQFEAALREPESLGADNPRLAETLNNLALVYQAQGRYAEAEPLFRRSLGIVEKALGPDHPDVAGSLTNLAELHRMQGRYTQAEPLSRRSLAIRERALGPDHPDVGQSLSNLAELYRMQGRYTEAEPLFRRSLAIRERALGPDHPDVGQSLNNLAELYRMQARYVEAEPLYRRSLTISEKALGPDHPRVLDSLNNLAELYQAQGRYAEAEPLLIRSLGLREIAPWSKRPAEINPNVGYLYLPGRYAKIESVFSLGLAKKLGWDRSVAAKSLGDLAVLYRVQGRYAESESLLSSALGIREKALGPDHPDVAKSLSDLAVLYQVQGRYVDAEPLLLRAVGIQEQGLGPHHPDLASSLSSLAALYKAQGRYADAEPLYLRSLGIWERALGRDHPDAGASLNDLAYLYQAQGRHADAESMLLRSLRVREKALGSDHLDVAKSLDDLAVLYQVRGRYADAEPLLRRALGIQEKALGPDHPSVGSSLNSLASLYRARGKIDEALALARRANVSLARRFTASSSLARGLTASSPLSRRSRLAEQRAFSGAFQLHVALLAAVAEARPEARAEATAESFSIAQLARVSDTAEQVGKMVARHAAGSDALAKLAQARQRAAASFDQLDTRIVQAVGQDGNEGLVAKLRVMQAGAGGAVRELDARLEREYPQYRELINPKPLEIAAAQQLLGNDEALVLFLASDDESYLWVLRRGEAGFFRLPVTRNELVEVVKKLRTQLDLGIRDPEGMLSKPFDVAAAHTLYRKLLGPAETLLTGAKQLIVVPDGALESLPPGVLVTELPVKLFVAPADHAQVAWLAKKYAITILPAVASLRALRQFAKPPASSEPFGGFGDPVLGGDDEGTRRTNIAALYSRGAVADVNEVRRLPRLPETADELRAIAAELKAPITSLWLGSAATERAVKDADLARFRNLAFATHGLMAGDFTRLAEPALVLTPPTEGSELDDGLLTAGEISQLDLDADWVVLSACNTAAPDGTPGAEGLSGLAKAFFYAGARSLLVSHWSVSSEAATALTTRMFEEYAKGATKAEALRRSMLALMARKDKWYFAHPAMWAPFVVVGEGNAEWAVRP